jgi:hypothetical protein
LLENWLDVWLNGDKDESTNGVTDLLDEATKARNLIKWPAFSLLFTVGRFCLVSTYTLNSVRDGFGDVIAELQNLPQHCV